LPPYLEQARNQLPPSLPTGRRARVFLLLPAAGLTRGPAGAAEYRQRKASQKSPFTADELLTLAQLLKA